MQKCLKHAVSDELNGFAGSSGTLLVGAAIYRVTAVAPGGTSHTGPPQLGANTVLLQFALHCGGKQERMMGRGRPLKYPHAAA